MAFDIWRAFAAASFVLIAIPGPTVLLVVSYALSQGRQVAIATALGVALGDTIAVSASLMGVGALLLTSAWVFSAIKWIGAAYLVYLGVTMLRAAPEQIEAASVTRSTPRRVFFHAALVTALNPKGILFFLAFVPQFIRPEQAIIPQFATMLITFVTLGALNALAYALLAAKLRDHAQNPILRMWMNRAGGAVLIGMGAMTSTFQR